MRMLYISHFIYVRIAYQRNKEFNKDYTRWREKLSRKSVNSKQKEEIILYSITQNVWRVCERAVKAIEMCYYAITIMLSSKKHGSKSLGKFPLLPSFLIREMLWLLHIPSDAEIIRESRNVQKVTNIHKLLIHYTDYTLDLPRFKHYVWLRVYPYWQQIVDHFPRWQATTNVIRKCILKGMSNDMKYNLSVYFGSNLGNTRSNLAKPLNLFTVIVNDVNFYSVYFHSILNALYFDYSFLLFNPFHCSYFQSLLVITTLSILASSYILVICVLLHNLYQL